MPLDNYNANDRVVDGVVYSEAGTDILYYTDNFFKIRKLRCEIPENYVPNFLEDRDLQLQRRGVMHKPELGSIIEGGSLFCGSYQIAIQLVRPDVNQYTKFSMLSNPIHIFLKPKDGFGVGVKSGIGLQSTYKIKLNIELTDEEAAYYTHFRLAVLENIYPKSGALLDDTNTNELVQLTTIQAISDFVVGTTLQDVEYAANVRLETMNLADIVVDLMALSTAKTLAVRENRLVAGNIKLVDTSYDNGDPTVEAGAIIKKSSTATRNSFADAEFASRYVGHFRDEVYRYAIAYYDEDMNFSFPKVLDLSSITYNQFGRDPLVIPATPELILDPTFGSFAYWNNLDYTADDPISNPAWAVGGDAIVTFSSGPLSSQYLRQAIMLDSTKSYKYEVTYTNSITSYNMEISFWNNSVRLSQFFLVTSGVFTPPAGTTHIGLRVMNTVGTGTFTFQNFSLKENQGALPLPPVTVSGYDVKYPSRAVVDGGESFTLFDSNGRLQSLGLHLTGIDHHPTWAKGFVILRAKRIKDLLFQTPIIPMNSVYGVGPVEEYPTFVNEISGTGRRGTEYPSAQPMGPFITYVPRNYHWANAQNIEMFAVSGGATGSGLNKKYTGEAYLTKASGYTNAIVFPPGFMYEDKPFLFNPNHQVESIDAILADKFVTDYATYPIGSSVRGRNIKTSVAATFYGLDDASYYYNSSHGGAKPTLSVKEGLSAYGEFKNYGTGTVIGGDNIYRYDKLETSGIFWGVPANVQKSAIMRIDGGKSEINNNSSLLFAAGTQPAKPSIATQAFDTNNVNCQTIEIVNIRAGLTDTRYGKVDTAHEFILTGTQYAFDEGELATVSTGDSTPIDVDVWGGDCYVTPHLFKITDTVYGVSNSEKHEGLGGLNLTDGVRNWEKSFNDLETASESNISVPVAYKNVAQYLQVVMESEYNAGIIDTEVVSINTAINTDFPLYCTIGDPKGEGGCRAPLTYEINTNHKRQNSDKIFRIKDPLVESILKFGSRIIYSDQKIYQTNINGFDIFRVLNYYDLEETYGSIHALAVSSDDLYSLSDRAVVYIAVGKNILETSDALQLSVQTDSFIGRVMYIDTNRGTQHLKSVLKTGTAIYFVDNRNKTFNRVAGKSLDILSESTVASTFRQLMADERLETQLLTHYDHTRKQVLVSDYGNDSFCYVFDEPRQMWITRYDFPSGGLLGSAYIGQTLFVLGNNVNGFGIHSMYTGDRGQLLGTPVVPSVTSIVNPQMEVAKRFDAVLMPAGDALKAMDIIIDRPISIATQSVLGTSLDVNTRGESNYRTKILRGDGDARLRGLGAKVKILWYDNTTPEKNLKVVLPTFLTKYTPSENRF